MPPWPGGPCPQCGEEMPVNMIHCRNCRALLNSDFHIDSVEIPAFIPLQEIESMIEVQPTGHFIGCPGCLQELRIHRKYIGETVQCKFCQKPFKLDLSTQKVRKLAFYSTCPHCTEELRVAHKYIGMKVACKLCGGKIHLVEKVTA